jgi:hypothetical protein
LNIIQSSNINIITTNNVTDNEDVTVALEPTVLEPIENSTHTKLNNNIHMNIDASYPSTSINNNINQSLLLKSSRKRILTSTSVTSSISSSSINNDTISILLYIYIYIYILYIITYMYLF